MKIGEVAKVTGATTKTIRFYEGAGLLPEPERTQGGHREYDGAIAGRLAFIRQCQAAGMTLHEVRQVLTIHDQGESPCSHVRTLLAERLDLVRAQIAELLTLEAHLETLLGRADAARPSDHDGAAVCWILEGDAPIASTAAGS